MVLADFITAITVHFPFQAFPKIKYSQLFRAI